MQIKSSTPTDIKKIFDLYRIATAYMKSKNQVCWPEFPRSLIDKEIEEKRQWKILIDNQIACVWATTLNDELIWGKKNNTPALYIHRIAANPDFRGQNLVQEIVNWADDYCKRNDLKAIRMDTVGYNEGLINHYAKFGFEFLGMRKIEDASGLPGHYGEGEVCLFEREVE
ncbi:MAG: GNAT family N-acetyltransferase [Saprospiraceae bacterium]